MIDSQLITMMNAWTDTGGPGGQLVSRAEIYNVFQGLIEQTTLTDLGTPVNGKIVGVVGGQFAQIDPPAGGGSFVVSGSKGPGKIPKVAANGNDVEWMDDLTSTPGGAGTLQAVMDAGFETNKGFYFNRTLTPPTINGQAVTQIWAEFDNLAKTNESAPYQRVPFLIGQKAVRQGGDDPIGKVNETMMMGWNLAPGGSQYIANRPGIGISFESNFRDAGQRLVEMHDFMITPGGQQIRGRSYTYRTQDFVIDYYQTVSRWYLKLPDIANVQNEKQYFVISPSNNSVNFGFGPDMGGRDGGIKSIVFEANFLAGGGFSISNAGLIQPEVFFQGFTHINMPGIRTGQIGGGSSVKIMGSTSAILDLETHAICDQGTPDRRFRTVYTLQQGLRSIAADATVSDLPTNTYQLIKNTTNNEVRLWVNDGGVMKKTAVLAA